MGEAMLGTEAFINRVVRTDAPLAEKIIGKILDLKEAFGRIGDTEAQAQHKRLAEAERMYLDAIEAAGKKFEDGKIVSVADDEEEEKEKTAQGGGKWSLKIAHTDGTIEEIADARDLTENKVEQYINHAKSGKLRRDTYIPIRNNTPRVIIDTLKQINVNLNNRSLVIKVEKIQQAMKQKNPGARGKRTGSGIRPHSLGVGEIIEIINNLDYPSYIVYQTNRLGKHGQELPNNIVVIVEYGNEGKEGGVAIEFENPRDTDAIGKEFGDVEFYTINTIFPPDNMRNDAEFDYFADELFSNDNNIVFEIDRRQPMRSATGEKHPNTSNELPSNAIIQQNSEKSTPKGQFSFKEDLSNNEKVGESVEKTVDNNKKPTSYTKAEAAEMVDGIMESLLSLSHFFIFADFI